MKGGDGLKRKDKERLVEEIKEKLNRAEATFLVDYRGLNVEEMTKIRRQLRDSSSELKVIKNRLLKIASQGTKNEVIIPHLSGPCALAIAYEDVVAPAKILVDFSKENEKLEIKAGQVSGKVIDLEGIKSLAQLPGREQLLAQLLSLMVAVQGSFLRTLNGIILKLLYALKEIEKKKHSDK